MGSKSLSVPREGALLRVTFEDHKIGYSDCFSWPELGDSPLDQQLYFLKLNQTTPITQKSLEFARMDAIARAENRSLFKKKHSPDNHALVTDWNLLTLAQLETFKKKGFQKLKLKSGSDPFVEARRLRELYLEIKRLSLKVRLDFNASLQFEEFEEFLFELDLSIFLIDFIEDPFEYNSALWGKIQLKWGIRLGLDRLPDIPLSQLESNSFSVLIVKPANQTISTLINLSQRLKTSLVVTSYLDHPLGQLFAAWSVEQMANIPSIEIETCGLLSHEAYEPNSFSETLETHLSTLVLPKTQGIGMGPLLEGLDWQLL